MSWWDWFKFKKKLIPNLDIERPFGEEDKILLFLSKKPKVFSFRIENQILEIRKECLRQDVDFLDMFLEYRSVKSYIESLEKDGYIQYNRASGKWNLSFKARERIKILLQNYPSEANLAEAIMHDWLEDKKLNPSYSWEG